ncbi:DUF742 domain-containing protein [Actinokineospora iranica]|uniref:DUF742 domain-containing protein n=1 Tax=Actinokineospora iranica TaxID=1271860 RepID=A0A1G6K7N6_9PSEU|nr:DUF742 domain-containing protein [Actinokineospora iranica]SDC26967.1 Protein of unknown function [Actinokineospora iranica]
MSSDWAAEPEQTIADVMNGLTLGGGRKRKFSRSEVDTPRSPVQVVEAPLVEVAPAQAGSVEPDWPDREDSAPLPVVVLPDPVEQPADAAIVRPYAWTRGRTRSNFELRLETMVSTSDRAADLTAFAESEHRVIGALCRDPRSVAEVATLLGAPLGVAKVLLGDMAQLGLVTVHKTATGGANRAHLVLMERVLSGLRRL